MAPADPDVAALYGLEPAEFVAARNDLARRLRSAGRKQDADRVAKLRRPVPAAWALNQVAREQPEVIAAALAEGARLRQALDSAVGGNAGGVRAAQTAERDAVAAAVAAARSRLEAAGHADVTPRVANTLRAAVLDDELAARLREGVISVDAAPPGFAFGDGAAPDADTAPADDPAPKAAAARREAEQRAEAQRLAGEAETLAQAADAAAQAYEQLREQADDLQARLRDAERKARQARRDADSAAARAERAQRRRRD